ncbi:MAG: DNA damage-inducible protein D, partial [Microscillaceae bacterium]|nr:DNA damage-inducible protein D [Microscillaceae bacterium]
YHPTNERETQCTYKTSFSRFLPTITITAKNLATEITNFNVKNDNLLGEQTITSEHTKNNQDVRNLLLKNNILPENLPAEKDIKKLERSVKQQNKKLPSVGGKF